MELGLDDKVVLVTGGSDGLGLALANELVREGARVAVCGRDAERLAAAVTTLLDDGGDAIGVVADVTRPGDLDHFVDAALERWGRIDGVVNNAGRASAMALVESTDEDWDADLQLKVYAAVRLARRTIPHLRTTRGSIVNVLAVAAKQPAARSSPTSVSRAAGMALTKALSKELGPEGIRVNAVLIGFVESGQWERMAEQSGTPLEEVYAGLTANAGIPLGRVGRAQEFADLVAYLLSDRASYVTGTAINLDGGLSGAV
jgi:NAD(P)-dependent dehydrogenase (short-subunit alcohol dehydrogenase family)